MQWKYLIAVGMSLLLCLGTAGCGEIKVIQYEEEDNSQEESDASDTEQPTEAATEIVDRPDEEYDAISNTFESWWFMRNTDHTTPGCQEDFDITPYRAYYVNKDATDKVIYLTFDCGYENGYTGKILDILKENDVKAIFFVTQYFIEQNPDLIIRMKEEGHLVGNHTNHHPSLPELSIEEQREEISSCAEYMKEATGYEMDPYIRPPKGEYSERTLQLFSDMGYYTVFWSMAYLDYEVDNQPTAEYVVQHFDKYCHPGAVPLIHNVSSANTEALPQVIEHLREAGYRFGTVDEFCHN
jgi:peptidoglycan-N-acetylmuramic acid deacetylase